MIRPLMEKTDITCYLKPSCGWSEGVRSVLRKHGLEWEEKDVVLREWIQSMRFAYLDCSVRVMWSLGSPPTWSDR